MEKLTRRLLVEAEVLERLADLVGPLVELLIVRGCLELVTHLTEILGELLALVGRHRLAVVHELVEAVRRLLEVSLAQRLGERFDGLRRLGRDVAGDQPAALRASRRARPRAPGLTTFKKDMADLTGVAYGGVSA